MSTVYFKKLLRTCLAEAYFDESGTSEDLRYLCVAGYIFTKENALAIDGEWRRMLEKYGLPYFHMSECNQHKGIYGHLTQDQCIAAATDAIELIKKYAARGIAISFDKLAYAHMPPQDIWGNLYSFLCSQVMFGVVRWSEDADFDGDVSYFYESGAAGWGNAQEAMARLRDHSDLPREGLRFKTFTSMSKKDSVLLQAADILAWQWRKQMSRRLQGIKKLRGDFKSLKELPTDFHEYDKDSIHLWLNFLSQL